MHLIGQNKHWKFTCNCNALHILRVTITCAELCWQTYLGTYSSAFCHIWALKKALRRVTSAKGSQKSEYYMLAFDWLEQTDKLGAIFSLREWLVQSYGARLFGNIFNNFVSNFSLEGGNWLICLWQHHISKMGYCKCTILFNICTISFLSYYDIGCTMFR